MTAKCNLLVNCGETFGTVFVVRDSSGLKDLTGYTGTFTARPYWDSDTVLMSLTTSNGGIVLGGTAGTVTLSCSSAVTRAISIPTLNPAIETRTIGKDQDGNLLNVTGYIAPFQLELSNSGIVVRAVEGDLIISPALYKG